jgi:hypothetical protein
VALIEAGIDNGFRLVVAYAADEAMGLPFRKVLDQVTKAKSQTDGYRRYYWGPVAGVKSPEAQDELTSKLAIEILAHAPSDWRRPTVPHALVERYAEDLGVNVAQAWGRLQTTIGGKLAGGPQLEELFLFHSTDELRALAKELGVGAPESATRAGIVKLLLMAPLNNTRRLPLPKCIKPLPAAKVVKGKGAARGKK